MSIKQVRQCLLSEADVSRMITSEPNAKHKALFSTLYGAALRVSEVCNLRWGDVRSHRDVNTIIVRHDKMRPRNVFISAGVWNALQAIRGDVADDAPVFTGPKGKPLKSVTMRKIFRDAASRVELPKTLVLHDLRRAHMSHSHDRGAPRSSIVATMGYRDEVRDFIRPRPDSGLYLAI